MDLPAISIAVVNRKGGCSKTSTCYQLAGAFSSQGKRVLLADLDPQANLTQGFFGPAFTEQLPASQTALSLFRDDLDPDPAKIILPTKFANVSILPGASGLEDYNLSRPTTMGVLQTALRTFMTEAQGLYDIALFDCPPNLQLCTWNALLAADFVLVPLQPEDFGGQGITSIQRFVDLALQQYNPRLRMLGYLVTQRKRLALHDTYEKQLRTLYGDMVLTHPFHDKKDYKESVSARQPIHFYKPKVKAAKEVMAIADELLERVERLLSEPAKFLFIDNRLGLNSPLPEVA